MAEHNSVLTEEEKRTLLASPTLIIGLGGTGAEVLSRVRDQFFSALGPLENYPVVRYLWLDTDTQQATHTSNWYKRHQQFANQLRFQASERVDMTVPDTEFYLSHLSNHPHIARWIYPFLNSKTSINEGAGQIRAYGRLALFHNVDAIVAKLDKALSDITALDAERRARANGLETTQNNVNIILVGSVAGGTGSGTYLDMAYLVRQHLRKLGGTRKANLIGYLVLPSVFGGTSTLSRLYANGYAALMELNHFNYSPPEESTNESRSREHDFVLQWSAHDQEERLAVTPFDICYIVDGVNLGGQNASGSEKKDTIFTMIAENILQDFHNSAFAGRKRSHRDNLLKDLVKDAVPLIDMGADVRFPKRHFSFGLASITFPYESVRKACASQLAADIVDYWLRSPDQALEATEYLRDRFLGAIGMEEVEARASRPPKHDVLEAMLKAGATQNMLYEVQNRISDMGIYVRDLGTDKAGKPWGLHLREEIEKMDRDWAGETTQDKREWGEYVRRMRHNLDEYMTELKKRLETQVLNLVNNEHRGIGFAREVLNALDYELVRETHGYIDTWMAQAKQFQEQRQFARSEMEAALSALNVHWDSGNWFTMRDVTLRKTLRQFEEAAVQLYIAQVEYFARQTAIMAAQEVRKWIASDHPGGLRSRLENLQRDLTKLHQSLCSRVSVFSQKRDDDRHILLYEGPEDFKRIYDRYVPDAATQAKVYNEQALKALGVALMDLRISDVEAISDRLASATTGHFAQMEEDYDALTLFIEKYPPGHGEWTRMIDQVMRACQPWLSWEQSFIGLREKVQGRFLVGVKKNHPRYKEFEAAVINRFPTEGYQSEIVDLNSPSQILFYTEVAGFALCQTTAVRPMREQYFRQIAQDSRNDLHTDRRDSRFNELVVLTQSEQIELRGAARAFLLGTILNLVHAQERQDNRQHKYIRYVYKQKGVGLFAEEVPIGVEDAVIPYLRAKKDSVLKALNDDIDLRLSTLQGDPERWAEFAALMEFYRQRYYPKREVDLGNGTSQELKPIEWRVLEDEFRKAEQVAMPGFANEVMRKYQELETGRTAFAMRNLAGRLVMNLAQDVPKPDGELFRW